MTSFTLKEAQMSGVAPWSDPQLTTVDFAVFADKYPVTEGHTLIVPRKNTNQEILKCFQYALAMGTDNVLTETNNITGFNIGLNWGESAGQTVDYPHIHLIFRRDGDMEDPRGGVRHVIPEKGNYLKDQPVTTISDVDVDSGEGC